MCFLNFRAKYRRFKLVGESWVPCFVESDWMWTGSRIRICGVSIRVLDTGGLYYGSSGRARYFMSDRG